MSWEPLAGVNFMNFLPVGWEDSPTAFIFEELWRTREISELGMG